MPLSLAPFLLPATCSHFEKETWPGGALVLNAHPESVGLIEICEDEIEGIVDVAALPLEAGTGVWKLILPKTIQNARRVTSRGIPGTPSASETDNNGGTALGEGVARPCTARSHLSGSLSPELLRT